MKKRWASKTILRLLLAWFVLFAVDVTLALCGHNPIFMLPMEGGEITVYLGLGYRITHTYGMTPSGYVGGEYTVMPVLYLILNAVILFRLWQRQRRSKAKEQ